MVKENNNIPKLKHLGSKETIYPYDYSPDFLETIEDKNKKNDYVVTFNCPEFTSLCPVTGQPDFGSIVINYIANGKILESKSLKLYLFSFRQYGAFHEDCTNIIMNDLIEILDPKYIEVKGNFMPRGGISIMPFANYAKPGTKYEEFVIKRRFEQLDK